jgi:hypothetical protein
MNETHLPSKTSCKGVPRHNAPQKKDAEVEVSSIPTDGSTNQETTLVNVPLPFKLTFILLISAIGFGSSWSGGITGAMKTTLKKIKFQSVPN